jgi:hypothetical protein
VPLPDAIFLGAALLADLENEKNLWAMFEKLTIATLHTLCVGATAVQKLGIIIRPLRQMTILDLEADFELRTHLQSCDPRMPPQKPSILKAVGVNSILVLYFKHVEKSKTEGRDYEHLWSSTWLHCLHCFETQLFKFPLISRWMFR